MSISTVECANCGDPTQQASLDKDGHCPRCSTCRTSSPPPEPSTPAPDVSRFKGMGSNRPRKSVLEDKLHREPLKSKIPIADWLKNQSVDAT
ncbi:MAG: hypothetical protein NUW08_01260 [Candidatus Uhrbacteria bacterium]|nr:hypothetical protein [Candidatus Uhrbacteria bacterium]